MDKWGIITLALIAAAVACELAASWREDMKWRARFKPFIVLTILFRYLLAAAVVRGMFVAALVFCLLGDLLLIPRKTYYAGGVAFALAHVMFALTYINLTSARSLSALLLLPAIVYAANAVFITARLRSHVHRNVVRVSIGYLALVSVMSVTAFALALSQSSAAGWLVYIGSVFFVASDSVLLIRNYRKDIHIPKVYFVVMLTYIIALALMTTGMMRIG